MNRIMRYWWATACGLLLLLCLWKWHEAFRLLMPLAWDNH
jgi:hypothetical protein